MSSSNTKKASCWRSSGRSATDSVATTDADAGTPPDEPAAKKTSRAGRDLPAAIAVGVSIGAVLIATLVFAPHGWVILCSGAIFVASHEVVRRLREAGYVIPVIPLLIGGQVTVWLTWPYGARGALAGFGATVVVCMFWRLFMHPDMQESRHHDPDAGPPPPSNYLRDASATDLPDRVGPAVRLLRRVAGLPPAARRRAGVLPDDHRRRLRRGRLHVRGAVRQASAGSDDQPEEVVGGIRRFVALRDHRGGSDRDLPGPQTAVGGRCCWVLCWCSPARWATWWNPRSSATSASRTWAGCFPATVA